MNAHNNCISASTICFYVISKCYILYHFVVSSIQILVNLFYKKKENHLAYLYGTQTQFHLII